MREADEEDEEEEEEDEEEDEEEEEEEEEDVRNGKGGKKKQRGNQRGRKRRTGVSSFFLDEADVADEDEEEEEIDIEERRRGVERILPEHEKAAVEAVRRRHEQNQKFLERSDEEIARDYERRHVQETYVRPGAEHMMGYGYGDRGGGGASFVPQSHVMQQALLPSTSDPSIWMVRVAVGKEQLVVRSIMLKCMEAINAGMKQTIKSAFATSSKGYIYIEALAEPHAREVLSGLRMVLQYTFSKVPLDQMTSIMNVNVKRKPLKNGALVRFKRGPLKGDLALVVDLIDGGERAFVQAVPRPDYAPKVIDANKKVVKNSTAARPPQRLLDIEEARKHGHLVDRKRHPTYRSTEMYDFFSGDYYKKGYLVKEVVVATYLTSEDVNPKLAELRMFQELRNKREEDEEEDEEEEEDVDGNDGDENASKASSRLSIMKELSEHLKSMEGDKKKGRTFQEGDVVQVTGGELINLIGQVLSMDPVTRLVKLRALNNDAIPGDLLIEASLLMKHITPGQHIKVTSGPNLGQTGRVVSVSSSDGENLAYILTDGTKAEITCNVEHLLVTEEVNAGLDSLMGYEVYDLVDVTTSEVAVVVRVGTETLKLLTNAGTVKELRPLEVRLPFFHVTLIELFLTAFVL